MRGSLVLRVEADRAAARLSVLSPFHYRSYDWFWQPCRSLLEKSG
ncbi:MAG: hypothetical protein ACK47B_00685 [Armatimonadota bacterium]